MFFTTTGAISDSAFCDAHSTGAYVGKPSTLKEVDIETRGEFILYSVENAAGEVIKFILKWDGKCISTLYDEKEARSLLDDFAPIQKKRGRPPKNKTAIA